jgi:hypothetical protein
MKTILAAIDFSPVSSRAISVTLVLAQVHRARIVK